MLIWDKGELTGMGDLNIPFKPSHESIFILGKWPKPKPGVKRIGGVIKAPAPQPAKSQGRFHPTEKPTSLMELLIGQCPPGVIVDPFAGGGSTLRAAKNQGRKAIGFEIEERYCETIAKRLAQENLF